jgi:hypothetical protein
VPAASGGLTITTGSTDFLAPDGTSGSITKYVGGAASGVSQYALYAIGYDIAVTASGAHTLSMFVRAGATNPLNFVGLSYNGFTAASGTTLSYFSLASGTALTSGASIQNYGNGWYRLILPPLTIASGDLVGSAILYFAQGNGNANWSASGALNLTAYAWGLQMEAGSIATSYIPTNTAAVTRNADVISVSGAVSGCIGQTEGTLYTEIETQSVVGSTGVLLQIGSGNNRVYIARESATSLQLQLGTQSSAGFNFINHTFSGSVAKIAIGYASGNNAFYVNGTQVSTASATANPSSAFTEIILGISPAISQRKQRAVALYTTRLPNEELELLTYPTYYSNVRDLIWGTFVSRNSTFSELPSCLQTRHNQLIIV